MKLQYHVDVVGLRTGVGEFTVTTGEVEVEDVGGGEDVRAGQGYPAARKTASVTRSASEAEALYQVLVGKHARLCFAVRANPLPASVAVSSVAPTLPTSHTANHSTTTNSHIATNQQTNQQTTQQSNQQITRQSTKHSVNQNNPAAFLAATIAFLRSVAASDALMADAVHVRPFFFSPFKYIPEPFTPAPLSSRRSVSNSAFSLVFSKRQEDVDVFFSQVKLHISALHAAIKAVTKEIDLVSAMQLEYASTLQDLDSRLAEASMQEQCDSIAGQYRKLAKVLSALNTSTNTTTEYNIIWLKPMLQTFKRTTSCMQIALDARLATLDEYEDACKYTQRKRAAVEKIGNSSTSSSSGSGNGRLSTQTRAESAIWELREANEAEAGARGRFVEATDLIRGSYGR
ncbi:hypothetical protein HK100_008354, partial [Physocladia obscura]